MNGSVQGIVLMAAVAGLLGVTGCKKPEKPVQAGSVAGKAAPAAEIVKPLPPPERKPLHVQSVEMGNKLTSDGTIVKAMESFSSKERIIGLVALDGYGKGTLTVKWLPDGSSALKPSESTMEVETQGWKSLPFTLENTDTWPPGEHRFEVLLNGKTFATKKFTVK